MKMPSIFIAEDDKQLRNFYKIALESKGYTILAQTGDGEEAISLFKKLHKKPDIIILDYRMPNKNGIQILEEILKIENTARIIFATADSKTKIEALSKGAKYFLEKPFSLEELYKTVLKLLKRKDIKINTSILS